MSIFKFLGHGSARIDTDFSFYLLFPFYLCNLFICAPNYLLNVAWNFLNHGRNKFLALVQLWFE